MVDPGRAVHLPLGVAILEVLEEKLRSVSEALFFLARPSRLSSTRLEGFAFFDGRRRGRSFGPGGGRAEGFSADLLRTFAALLLQLRPRPGWTDNVLMERCEDWRVCGLGLLGIRASVILVETAACSIGRDDLSFMISSHEPESCEAMISERLVAFGNTHCSRIAFNNASIVAMIEKRSGHETSVAGLDESYDFR